MVTSKRGNVRRVSRAEPRVAVNPDIGDRKAGRMAELTQLESKLGEILGLSRAAQEATDRIAKLVDDQEVKDALERMGSEAAEQEERCVAVASELEGKKGVIEEQAKETKSEAQEMMKVYLDDDSDALDGFEFLVMAEAGELGHVEIAEVLNEKVGNERIRELIEWARPVQERHVSDTRECALKVAGQKDPNEPAG